MDTVMITLRTGKTAPEPVVATTMLSLQHLCKKDPVSFYELVELCRDYSHQLWPGTEEQLIALSLIQPDCKVHSCVKDIVLAAVEGNGMNMSLRSPL